MYSKNQTTLVCDTEVTCLFLVNSCCDFIPQEIIAGYKKIPVANIGDARGRFGCMSWMIKPMNPDMRICGPALTVQTYRADNLAIHVALKMARPGDVLVIDAGGIYDTGLWGGLMNQMARQKKLGGIILDGGVRDSQELAASDFPVFARAVSPQGGFKASPGSVNVAISCGDVPVLPGDLVVGDADGIVVVPSGKTKEILEKSLAVVEKEKELRERMVKGETLYSLLKLDGVPESLGMTTIQHRE